MATSKKAAPKKAAPKKAAPKKAESKPRGSANIINVLREPEKAFRSETARDNYWQRVKQFNGKTVAALQESVAKEPPSMPKNGKLAGKVEPLSGWLSWFKQNGLIEIKAG